MQLFPGVGHEDFVPVGDDFERQAIFAIPVDKEEFSYLLSRVRCVAGDKADAEWGCRWLTGRQMTWHEKDMTQHAQRMLNRLNDLSRLIV